MEDDVGSAGVACDMSGAPRPSESEILNLHGLPHMLSTFKTVFGYLACLVLLIRAFPGLLVRDEPVHLVIFIFVMNRLLDAHIPRHIP